MLHAGQVALRCHRRPPGGRRHCLATLPCRPLPARCLQFTSIRSAGPEKGFWREIVAQPASRSSERLSLHSRCEAPEFTCESYLLENLSRLVDRPFFPIRICMVAVPDPSKLSDLSDGNNRAFRNGMTSRPRIHLQGASERQNGCAVMMDIFPGVPKRHREMNDDISLADRSAVEMDVDVLRLAADSRMDDHILVHERGNAASAPDARRPPAKAAPLNPRRRRTQRERMNDPRRRVAGMADDAVAVLQSHQCFRNGLGIGSDETGQRRGSRRKPIVDESADEMIMNRRIQFAIGDHPSPPC